MVTMKWLDARTFLSAREFRSKRTVDKAPRVRSGSLSFSLLPILAMASSLQEIRLVKDRKACYFDNRLFRFESYEKQAASARKSGGVILTCSATLVSQS
jgi:hypothetical protein